MENYAEMGRFTEKNGEIPRDVNQENMINMANEGKAPQRWNFPSHHCIFNHFSARLMAFKPFEINFRVRSSRTLFQIQTTSPSEECSFVEEAMKPHKDLDEE